MTLHIHHGPRLAPLAAELLDVLTVPGTDPFTTEVVAVPTLGVKDWLRRTIAARLGVAANVDTPFPGEFVDRALGRSRRGDEEADPWSIERVTWAILDVVERGAATVPGWPADLGPGTTSRFVVARRVADLFDRYAANRPQLVQQWAAGLPGDGTISLVGVGGNADADDVDVVGTIPSQMHWQFDLWRAVRAVIGAANPAEDLPDLLNLLTEGELDIDLPERAALFGVSTVTPSQIEVLRALAITREVHVFVVHPSPSAWDATAPLPSVKLVTRRREVGGGETNDDADADHHGLLRTWGRLTFEAAALLKAIPEAVFHPPATDDRTPAPHRRQQPTLLAQVQSDIEADRSPGAAGPRAIDATVEVHAGHGTVRQLEILRDVLDGRFAAEPTLLPRDVAVLCPDLSRFAPFVANVFDRSILPVPVAVTDLTLDADNSVADALARIVSVLGGRCGTSAVLDLAGLEPVRRRLGIDADDLEAFGHWVDELGTRWGLDVTQRTDWDHGDVLDGTWAATVDSLLLGIMMPAPVARVGLGEIVPFDALGATEMRRAGVLADLIERLRRARGLLAGHHCIDEWCDRLVGILRLLCRAEPDRAWQMAAITSAIEGLRGQAVVDNRMSTVELTPADIEAVLGTLLQTSRGRLRLRTGSVTVTDLVPVRNVPARVVGLLGFDEASLRIPSVDGDDLLSLTPCVGERDRRADHRHVLLDALMAATEHVVITCDGSDLTTNRRIRTPIQLAELLDVLDATTGADPPSGDVDHPTMTRHPRRAYDPRIFGATVGSALTRRPTPWGYDESMLRAARVVHRGGAVVERPSPFDSPLPLLVPDVVTIAELVDACARPARVLLRDRLNVRLPGEAKARDEQIPIEFSPLDSSALGRELLKTIVDSDEALDALLDRWRHAQRQVGRLPPRRLADHTMDHVVLEIVALLDTLHGDASDLALARARARNSVNLDLHLQPGGPPAIAGRRASPVRLRDTIDGVGGDVVTEVRYERPKCRHRIFAALRLAALVVDQPDRPWLVTIVTRGASKSSPTPVVLNASPHAGTGVAEAQVVLDMALGFRVDALRMRVPLFEKTSFNIRDGRPINEEDLFGAEFGGSFGADLDDEHAAFVWEGVTVDDLERRVPSAGDVAARLWGTIDEFARIAEATAKPTTRSTKTSAPEAAARRVGRAGRGGSA